MVDGTTLAFGVGLHNGYLVANVITDRVQVVRVPHYATLTVGVGATLTTNPYDYASGLGGIIALRATTVTVDGSVNVDGLGFVGGTSVSAAFSYGQKGNNGHSYDGTVPGGGSGGRGSSSLCSGGGGGYGTGGGSGSTFFEPGGASYGDSELSKIYLGSGGGSGGARYPYGGTSGAGGAGGGIIVIAANAVNGSGTLSSAGADGENGVSGSYAGGGGGGSGGSIKVMALITVSVTTDISGGIGGLNFSVSTGDAGGDGGQGRSAVSIGAPDLIITDLTAPLTAARGDTITVTSTVSDQQSDAATAPFKVGIYASLDPVITTGDIFLGDYSLTGLTGNASVTTAANVVVPVGLYADPPAGYQYRKKIAIHPVNGSGTAVLRDFPMLIDITDPALKSVANGGRVETGYDVVFTDALGAILDYEVEEYDTATGHLRAWVRVPELFGGVDTNIYLYYGNAAIMTSQANASGVWNGHYKTVFHQDEVPGSSAQLDSTANGNDAPDVNMAGTQNSVDAVVGKGIHFDGIDDYQRTQANVLDTGNSDWTLETWVKLDALNAAWNSLIQSEDNPTGQRLLFVDSSDGKLYSDTGSQVYGPGQGIPLGTWNHVVLVHDQFNDKSQWYINGAWIATSSGMHVAANNGHWRLGLGKDGSGALDGALDEIRVSDSQRSPEWIKAEYENMTSPSTFYSVGNEEDAASFSTQYSFYIGAVADDTDADVELNEFNNADVARDSSGAPQAIIINY